MISGHVFFQSALARCSQMNFEASLFLWNLDVEINENVNTNWIKTGIENRLLFGGGDTEKAVDMVIQGSSKSKIRILCNYI